jgi:hypothetical protein
MRAPALIFEQTRQKRTQRRRLLVFIIIKLEKRY